jgi:nucleoside-diphosphate-sugar epimerase
MAAALDQAPRHGVSAAIAIVSPQVVSRLWAQLRGSQSSGSAASAGFVWLGWQPTSSFAQGLEPTIDWFRQLLDP